ncbi:MAG: HlyC/CorC family transporter [Bacteroidetes bacterium]|nr:HlyC/CorC family transporter [Bacteroidota bacterium]
MSSEWIIILISLLCCAFFSGMEIAFLTSNKLRIELENKQNYLPARALSFFLKKPAQFIATCLVGNNISLVIYGLYMAMILEPVIHPYLTSHAGLLIVQTIISTAIVLLTAEFLPKALFRINPNRTLNLFAIPFLVIYWILYPVVLLSIGLSEFLLKKLFKVKLDNDTFVFGRVDLDNYVRQVTSSNEENEELDHEIQIFQNALDFSAVKVRECMVPRTEIVALDVNESIETLRQKFVETHLSKILIYDTSIDHLIGYVHSYELFKKPESIRAVLLPVIIAPESMTANVILSQLIKQRKSMAVVVDEFGGTSGMLTIEDIMEEIFGEIEDEHDKEESVEKVISESEYIFSARLEIDYLNKEYKLHLPESEDYETLGGLILNQHESIPELNEEISMEGFNFVILAVNGRMVEQVKLKVIDD